MPYLHGEATSLENLISQLVIWATDSTIHGDDAWTLMQQADWPKGTILKAKGLNGINSCYIGLMILDFTSSTAYSDWLLQTEIIEKKIVWDSDAINKPKTCFTHTSGSASFAIWDDVNAASKGTTTYTLSGYNDLINSAGKILVFGVFKQFIDGLDWNEQPGAMEFTDLELYPIYYTYAGYEGSEPIKLTPPIYPGWGYPGIAMPSGEPSGGYFKFWLVKDGSHLTVATNNCGQWDMGHAGMLEPFEAAMQYPFPAVVAGTCTGLTKVMTITAKNGGIVTTTGNKIDCSYDNWSMSRSLPCNPCENGTSQVVLCLPDGTWERFSNWSQAVKLRSYAYSSYETKYFASVERPARADNTADGFLVKPTNLDLDDVATGLASVNGNIITIEPLQLLQNDSANLRVDLFGALWGMYWPGTNSLPYGEVTINSKQYLLLPNCWEDRLWYIVPYTSTYTSQLTFKTSYDEIIDYGKQFKMLIELGG